MVCQAWTTGLTEDQVQQLQGLASFVGGEVYASATRLLFDQVIDDLRLRAILHPTMFVVTTHQKAMMKTNIITPTRQQKEGFRKLFDFLYGQENPGSIVTRIEAKKRLAATVDYIKE